MINKIWSLLQKRDKFFLLLLMFFSVFVAFIEMIGITAIMPFISVASDTTLIDTNIYYKYIYEFFSFEEKINFILLFGLILIFFYIFRALINLVYNYYLAKFANGRYHLFSYHLLENYLGMSYRKFTEQNSSELTKTIITEAQNVTTLISSALLLLSEIFVLIMIYAMMLYIDYVITLLITIFLLLNALFLIKKVSKRIKFEGEKREVFQKKFYEIINSTFGNFKFIKLLSNDYMILKDFEYTSSTFALSNIKTQTLYHVPRLLIESVAFVLVIFMILYLLDKNGGNITSSISIISMFVLGLYRLMPSANRIMSSYNIMVYNHKALDIIHENLNYDFEKLGDEIVVFKKKIVLSNISFGYNIEKYILDDVKLEIIKGDKIAFIGPSGSGKSTLVDIIIGLYKPIVGEIKVDGHELKETNIKNWRKKVGYIPQSVYLFDGTVAQNIVFGNEYNTKKIKDVLQKAKILDFLEDHQDGIDTVVGEGGVKLSGGQKQRIAIARALYQDPEILVLDEATSALDEDIEKEIMEEIYDLSKDKTLIIIAHRLSTIDRCDKVYKIEKKQLLKN